MKTVVRIILGIIVVFLVLITIGGTYEYLNPTTTSSPSSSMTSSSGLPTSTGSDTHALSTAASNQQTATIHLDPLANQTTLEDIIDGKYPTAVDKNGTNGVLVEVDNLRVEKVLPEADGDWHVLVTDGIQPVFITEITPFWQAKGVTQPPAGSVIDEVGTPFCDTQHQSEGWHDYTCWEIHPVEEWGSI